MTELTILRHLWRVLRARFQVLRAEPEAGYTAEAVVVIALLVALAIAAVAVIATKVLDRAQSISTGS